MVEVEQEVFAREIVPDFAGGEGFFYHCIEMFVDIHHFFPVHSRFYIKIEHNSHIPVRIVKDAVNFEFARIMVDGGILFQREDGLAYRMNSAGSRFRVFYGEADGVFRFFAFFSGEPEKQVEMVPDAGNGTVFQYAPFCVLIATFVDDGEDAVVGAFQSEK